MASQNLNRAGRTLINTRCARLADTKDRPDWPAPVNKPAKDS